MLLACCAGNGTHKIMHLLIYMYMHVPGICLATVVKAAVLHACTYVYLRPSSYCICVCLYTYMYTHTHTHTHTCSAPPISAPSMEYIGSTIQDAFVIAIVTFAVTVSLAQVFANKLNYTIHSNQVHGYDTYMYMYLHSVYTCT